MREVVTVPFGSGLDRATGALATDPGSFADLRNVILREGKLEARAGLTAVGGSFGAQTDVVGIFPYRAYKGGVAVTYNRTTGVLEVYLLDGTGAFVAGCGTWATLSPAAVSMPIISAAESKGKLFLAHDEPLYNYRAQTHYVELYENALIGSTQGRLVPLTADFNGDTVNEPVPFRGVRSYLAYMWGWGHGVASRPNAPEILRFSEGANPTVWPKNYYFVCGAADEAITNAGAAGSSLLVLKAAQSFMVFGDNPQNFGIRPVEEVYGTLNCRLGVEFGGAFYFWSESGPRVSNGGISVDLGIPLELDAPSPSTLVASGADLQGWCLHDPLRRIILWGFPDLVNGGNTRAYVLSVRDPNLFRWSYFELGQSVYCAGTVTAGAPIAGPGPGGEMTGYASNLVASDGGVYQTGRQVNLQWTNNAMIGGESAIILRRLEGAEWEAAQVVAVTGASQNVVINGPDRPWQALADYDIAIQFQKFGQITAGYEGSPDTWTHPNQAGSKTTVITSCSAPVITLGTWSRIDAATQQVLLATTLAELGIQFRVEESTNPVGSWAEVATSDLDQRPAQLVVNPPISEIDSYRNFRVRAARDSKFSPYSNTYLLWMGPGQSGGTTTWVFQNTDTNDFLVFLPDQPVNGYSWARIEIEARPEGGTWERVYLGGGLQDPVAQPIEGLSSPATFDNVTRTGVRVRFALYVAGVWDWGAWSPEELILLTDDLPPATPAAFTGTAYNALDDIDVSFAAGGVLGRLMYYQKTLALLGIEATYTLAEVNGGAVGHNFADLAHYPVGQPEGLVPPEGILYQSRLIGTGWDYWNVDGSTSTDLGGTNATPIDQVWSWAIDRDGGRAKISALPVQESITRTIAGAPTGVVVTPTGPGLVTVDWTNHRADGRVHVRWSHYEQIPPGPAFTNCRAIGPLVAIPANSLVGPSSGYAALPTLPPDLEIRVFVSVLIDGFEYFTAYEQVVY